MLLKYIDALVCPICRSSRLWKLSGDFTDERFANGDVICQNKHTWNITEDVMRLDEESSDEAMKFLDHNLTGFPKQIEETNRGEFLQSFEKFVTEFVSKSDTTIVIFGSPVLFVKYLPSVNREIIVVNPSEGMLRQVQEILASKRMYKKLSSIRAEHVELLLPDADFIYIFDNIPEKLKLNEHALIVERDADADIIWEEDDSILMYKRGL